MEPDFTVAKQWNRDDIQYVDIDLTNARTKPEAFGLAGKKLFVSLVAWDDKFTVSSSKEVGTAVATLNTKDGNPIELAAGLYYDFGAEFDEVYIRNVAQTGAMLRLVSSVDADIQPFSGEIQIVGATATAMDDAEDVALVAAAAFAPILAANTDRLEALIKNTDLANTARIGKAPTNTRGHLLGPGETITVPGTQEINGFSQAGATLSVTWTER